MLAIRFFMGIAVFLAAQAHATPIDCNKASTRVERQICSNDLILRLDRAVDRNYQGSLGSSIDSQAKQHLVRTQRDWLKKRNACRDTTCIEEIYRARVDALCEYPVFQGVNWGCAIRSEDIK
ncbi:MAG: lysozyme inhibitor LprI family protein [Brachymonas sp.]